VLGALRGKRQPGDYLEKQSILFVFNCVPERIDQQFQRRRTTGNSNMAAQTGSTCISESMTDIIKISTANLRFSTTASSKRMSLDDSNNDRQPEMAAETGNTYL